MTTHNFYRLDMEMCRQSQDLEKFLGVSVQYSVFWSLVCQYPLLATVSTNSTQDKRNGRSRMQCWKSLKFYLSYKSLVIMWTQLEEFSNNKTFTVMQIEQLNQISNAIPTVVINQWTLFCKLFRICTMYIIRRNIKLLWLFRPSWDAGKYLQSA